MLAAGLLCGALGALASYALANAIVYSNSFGSKQQVAALEGGGRRCDSGWNRRRKAMRITVTRGPAACAYKLPVIGDGPQPNHDLRAAGKIAKSTPKSARDNAYLLLDVRMGKDGGYELRVFPRGGEWRLTREPAGTGFPAQGTSDAIKGIGERNTIELHARNDVIRAYANGELLTRIVDANAGTVDGTRLAVGAGRTGKGRSDVHAQLASVKLAVP